MSSYSNDPAKSSIAGELVSLFCKPFDNKFDLKKYKERELIMIGDHIEFMRFFVFKTNGTVTQINSEWRKKYRVRSVYVDVNGKYVRVCTNRLKLLDRDGSYIEKWKKIFGGELRFYEELLSTPSSEKPSDTSKPLYFAPQNYFFWGLGLVQAGEFPNLVPKFFNRVIADAETIAEIYPKSEKSYSQTRNHLISLRYKAYACLMLKGTIPNSLASEISKVTQSHSADIPPSDWGGDRQDEYLSAIRLAILCEENETARKLLKTNRSFSSHKDQLSLLRKILRKTKAPSKDSALKQDCLAYLDYVRRPNRSDCALFGGTEPGLEWGCIVAKFFNSHPVTVKWENFLEIVYNQAYS